MPTSVYKTIYRIDFPASYYILDHLGEMAALVQDQAQMPRFSSTELRVNPINQALVGRLKSGQDQIKLTLNVHDLDAVIEHEGGQDVGDFPATTACQLANVIMDRLEREGVLRLTRAGLRYWIIVERKEFSFERIRQAIATRLETFGAPIGREFALTDDVGVVFESHNEEGTHARVMLGPYQSAEREKYFSIPQDVGEGLIIDIDVYQRGIEIRGFRFSELARRWTQHIDGVVSGVVNSLLGDLK